MPCSKLALAPLSSASRALGASAQLAVLSSSTKERQRARNDSAYTPRAHAMHARGAEPVGNGALGSHPGWCLLAGHCGVQRALLASYGVSRRRAAEIKLLQGGTGPP